MKQTTLYRSLFFISLSLSVSTRGGEGEDSADVESAVCVLFFACEYSKRSVGEMNTTSIQCRELVNFAARYEESSE